ncbi:MAG: hypothetical protein PWR24_2050 [Desulfonauticus sp.]|jgi:hypothetical protein|nr:MAG: hypothetical protein XD41_0938 [Desulfonauticus sp. 38_4375]MDK2922493.1 hypothetical protein [Desulfonauticus sp.]
MSCILLASSNFNLNPKALKYAWELSEELNSKFSILEVMSLSAEKNYLDKIKDKFKKIRWFLEDSMVSITYAEALTLDEYKKNIQKELEIINKYKPIDKAKIPDIYIKQGDIVKEIKEFIIKHRNIVMTILPVYSLGLNSKQVFTLRKDINTPLVVVK